MQELRFRIALIFQGLPGWVKRRRNVGTHSANKRQRARPRKAELSQEGNRPTSARRRLTPKCGVRWRTDNSKMQVLRFHFRDEKRPEPKKGNRHQLSDLWCCSGREVSAYQRPTPH
jgi:hypothetical protein